MLDRLLRRFHRRDSLRVRVEDSNRRGTGLLKSEWVLDELPIDDTGMVRGASPPSRLSLN